ncbi:MAG: hypothetical protein B6244_04755 [Candidatus Cloacimonetes bacterium 4572_55]|nr:MAG: hypothetical protein B6244_04755 [Candidatus Cloacimonetes bacterium 4572_55]
MSPIYTVRNLHIGYSRKKRILSDLNFTVNPGEFIAIIGPNGAGKTTLLRTLSGFLPPLSGTVLFQDSPVSSWSPRILAQSVALVGQLNRIEFDFTVWETVLMGRFPYLKKYEWEGHGDKKETEDALRQTDCYHFRDRRLSVLSGGERQRVMLARALAQHPSVLLLDEPTSHLDVHHRLKFFRLLKGLNRERQLTIITVLHDLNNAALFCRRLLLLADGGLLADGLAEHVLTHCQLSSVYGNALVIGEHPTQKTPQLFPNMENMEIE